MRLTSRQLKQIISEEVELMKLRKMIREEIAEAFTPEDIKSGKYKTHPGTASATSSTAHDEEEDEEETSSGKKSSASSRASSSKPGELPPLHPKSRK